MASRKTFLDQKLKLFSKKMKKGRAETHRNKFLFNLVMNDNTILVLKVGKWGGIKSEFLNPSPDFPGLALWVCMTLEGSDT